jgi:RNase P/RNase MRP subunit POP5
MAKSKKLKLRPSVRDRRRYFVARAGNQQVEKAILEYIGVLGFARAAYMKVEEPGFSGKTVGSCLVESLDEVRAALGLAGISIEKVSGTIKGLKG